MMSRIALTIALFVLATPLCAKEIEFKSDIYPILRSHCFACHKGRDPESGVRLDHYAKLLGETDGIPLIVPGKAAKSRLIQVVTGRVKNKVMPPPGEGRRLNKNEIARLTRWINQGAKWDNKLLPDPNQLAAQTHWAFKPVRRPKLPGSQFNNPIDAFVARKLKSRGIEFSEPANRETLVRRLALILQGFPLSSKERQKWNHDKSPNAIGRLTDSLLKSPHYGERIGRHWLDYARWAETEGFAQNNSRDFAWRYRDYVTESFNKDKPYSQFLRQQIAGDELTPYSDENLIATGFLAAARVSADDLDFYRAENDMYVDIVGTLSSSILGLTVACSQCHDHKFDPISQLDFYRLKAFFSRGLPGNVVLEGSGKNEKLAKVARDLLALDLQVRKRVIRDGAQEQKEPIRSLLQTAEPQRSLAQERAFRPARIKLNIRIAGCNAFRIKPDEKKKLDALRGELGKLVPKAKQTWGFYSPITSPHRLSTLPMKGNFPFLHDKKRLRDQRSYLLRRGQIYEPIATVEPGWPSAFGPTPKLGNRPRTALADWIASRRNPLTARVWVNRIWQMHFGQGLVSTPSNFGLKGAAPTHPDLLDWLSAELMDHHWSTKHIHRLIINSRTWQQSAKLKLKIAKIDPENRLWWRWPSRRLEFEAIRDSMLSVSGELDLKVGGPSIKQPSSTRRSLYLQQRRDGPHVMQALFDGPTAMSQSCSRRRVSTSALQSLYLLNNSFAVERARAFASRIRKLAGDDRKKQINTAFELALGRRPDRIEVKASQGFLDRYEKAIQRSGNKSLTVGKGLALWLRADRGVKTASNAKAKTGNAVVRWSDQSFGDNKIADDLTQSIAHRQPLFLNRPGKQMNGLPVVSFAAGPDGQADHFLRTTPSKEIDVSKGYTFFSVVRFNGKGRHNEIVMFLRDMVGVIRWREDGRMVLAQNLKGTWSDRLFSARRVPDGAPVLIVAQWKAPKLRLRVIASSGVVAGGDVKINGPIKMLPNRDLFVGGYALKKGAQPNDGERLNADIGEVLLYNRALSERDKNAVTDYLSTKWLTGADRALVLYAHAVFNLNEFLYVE